MRILTKIAIGISLLSSVVLAENHALIIGCCNDYAHLKNIRKLYGTENDAQHIFDMLTKERKVVSPQNAKLLTGSRATYHNITNGLKSMEKNPNLKAGDILYIFYSGHGTSLSDDGYFGKKLKKDQTIRQWISNSTGLVPYDLNPNALNRSLIITKRDFKPIFKRIDSKGVQIVWIIDACFAGNAHRSANKSQTQKFMKFDSSKIVLSGNNRDPHYKNLLFYSASLATLPTSEHPYRGEARGDFSVEVEKCLGKSYGSSVIQHGDLKKCLQSNFANTQIQPNFYPKNSSLDKRVIIKASPTPKVHHQSYKERLFALQSNQPLLNMSISSLRSRSQVIKTFCKNERLSVKLTGKRGKYIIALTQDKKGKVIMLQPNKKIRMRGNELFKTDVMEPFGTDKIKVFATNNKSIYNTALQFWDKPKSVLSSTDIEKLYKALKSSGDFQTASMTVDTISTDINICKKGD